MRKSKDITLLQEVELDEKREQLAKLKNIGGGKHYMTNVLKELLPKYEATDKMKHWHDAPQLHKGIKGGVRSGKTYTVGAHIIGLAYINRPGFHLSLSPSYDIACDTIVKVMEELCEENGLRHEWYRSTGKFSINFGEGKSDIGKIFVFGADQFFKGLTASSGNIDEPFSIAKRNYLIWWERISSPKSTRMERLWGGTAEPEKMSWGWEFFKKVKIDKEDLYADTITTYDNEHLPDEYIKSLEKKYDSRMRRVYMLGECINLSAGKVYHQFKEEKNVVPFDRVKLPKRMQILLGFDFNVSPMTAVEIVMMGRKRVQVDEYKIFNSDTQELSRVICGRLIDKYGPQIEKGVMQYSLYITGDASGRSKKSSSLGKSDYMLIKETFEKNKFEPTIYAPESNPAVRDRTNYVNVLLETEEYVICDNCTETIEDRELVIWKQLAEGFAIDKSNKELTHLSEAGDYALWISRMFLENEDGEYDSAVEVIPGEER